MKLRQIQFFVVFFILLAFISYGCGEKEKSTEGKANMEEVKKMETELNNFIKEYVDKFKPLSIKWATASFQAEVTGKKEDRDKADELEITYNSMITNKEDFKRLVKIKASGLVQDEVLKRELLMLWNEYLSKQIDTAKLNAMTLLQSQIVQKYNNFRAKVGKKEFTDNDVEEFLKTSKDSKKLEEVWLAHKKIGPVVAADIIKLVKMRNEVAKELGFNNYHEMSLILSDQDPKDIEKLFNELNDLTRDAFKQLKAEMDAAIAKQCNITPDQLMPWHYQNRYFQEAPQIYDVDLDTYYKDKDLVKTTEGYYKGLEMPIDDIVARSDLFEKEGKNQHAFCTDIDRDAKDIRVLCNVRPNSGWMETLLHEYGHALYEKYLGDDVPWILKSPPHIFTTEAIAMMFGRFASNPQWMSDVIGISKEEKDKIAPTCKKILRLQELVFSRWSQVMYRFEKGMYENPDQDLNKLWWDLVERYQMVKKPAGRNEPDWATKTHIASSPCYYHNYHLGELLASQLYYTIVDKVLKQKDAGDVSFVNNPEVGKFLKVNVFGPGAKYYWNDMIEKATGEKLTAKYYAKQFVQ